jgi:hypothetical protein
MLGDDAVETGPQLRFQDGLTAGTTAGANLFHHSSPDAELPIVSSATEGRPRIRLAL